MVCDEELIQKHLKGDETAFREIVDKYKAYIFAIILNFVKKQDEAENIAQEVFIQIYRSLPKYKSKNFKGWIGKIATTKAIDYKRTYSKTKEEPIVDIETFFNKSDENIKTPEEIVIQEEERKLILELCSHIPEKYSEVVIKYYFNSKSYHQIASELNIAVKTVESRLYRARALLRKKWEDY